MSTAGNHVQLRLRNQTVHLLPLVKRGDVVFFSPHNQHGHLQFGQQPVGGVVAGKHRAQGPMDHPGIPAGNTQDVLHDECRNLGRIGHEQCVKLVQFERGRGE